MKRKVRQTDARLKEWLRQNKDVMRRSGYRMESLRDYQKPSRRLNAKVKAAIERAITREQIRTKPERYERLTGRSQAELIRAVNRRSDWTKQLIEAARDNMDGRASDTWVEGRVELSDEVFDLDEDAPDEFDQEAADDAVIAEFESLGTNDTGTAEIVARVLYLLSGSPRWTTTRTEPLPFGDTSAARESIASLWGPVESLLRLTGSDVKVNYNRAELVPVAVTYSEIAYRYKIDIPKPKKRRRKP